MKCTLVVLFICLEFINCAWCTNLPYSGKNEIESETMAAECECENGFCEKDEKEKLVCKCPPEHGHYTTKSCSKCECGKGANCTWSGFWRTTKSCVCRKGYTDVKGTCKGDCNGTPCKNGGTCKVVGNEINCDCLPPYSGDNCEESTKDACNPNPCQNNATCETVNGKAKCKCKSPYTGDLCEKDPCISNPCKNAGVCKVVSGKVNCMCKDPYSGNFCETDPCRSNPCKNAGVCKVVSGNVNCTCKDPYSGNFCETDPCRLNPCKNAGVCKVVSGKVNCTCKDPYSGNFCETDPCRSNPCKNDGVCKVVSGKVNCTCKDPYSGNFCETEFYCTNDGDCKNDAKCEAEVTKKCMCKDRTKGDNCEIVTDCESDGKYGKCKGDEGTCTFESENAVCKCSEHKVLDEVEGYCKERCEIKCGWDSNINCHGDQSTFETTYCGCREETMTYDVDSRRCKVDHCASNPCQNGGYCRNREDTFECTCISIYGGRDCSENIWCDRYGKELCGDEKCHYNETLGRGNCVCNDDKVFNEALKLCVVDHCTSNPCKNGGSCQNRGDTFKCTCTGNYIGYDCSKNIWCDKYGYDLCGKEKCRFDDTIGTGSCQCEDGQVFHEPSKRCIDTNTNNCSFYYWKVNWQTAVRTCENEGKQLLCYRSKKEIDDITKIFGISSSEMVSLDLWLSKRNCSSHEMEECLSIHIQKHGKTVWHYFQKQCEEEVYPFICCSSRLVDHCASNPCKNGGSCRNIKDTFECTCTGIYKGNDCSENIWCDKHGRDLCGKEKCQYNETLEKGYCVCEYGQVFHDPSKACIDPCTPNPCHNGGTCTVYGKVPKCACAMLYSGSTCDIDNRFITASILAVVFLMFSMMICGGCCMFKINQKLKLDSRSTDTCKTPSNIL